MVTRSQQGAAGIVLSIASPTFRSAPALSRRVLPAEAECLATLAQANTLDESLLDRLPGSLASYQSLSDLVLVVSFTPTGVSHMPGEATVRDRRSHRRHATRRPYGPASDRSFRQRSSSRGPAVVSRGVRCPAFRMMWRWHFAGWPARRVVLTGGGGEGHPEISRVGFCSAATQKSDFCRMSSLNPEP